MTTQLSRPLDETITLSFGGRIRVLWDKLFAAFSDMNYACRRMVELQAFVGDQSR
jgi:hypothetical protein